MSAQNFTIHLSQRGDGKVSLKAIDDQDKHEIEGEYDNLSMAALEGVIALKMRRMNLASDKPE